MPPPASRASVLRLLSLTHHHGCRGGCGHAHHNHPVAARPHVHTPSALSVGLTGMRGMATPVDIPYTGQPPPGNGDFAFEMASSTLRFGQGATTEVGMDFSNMIAELPASERANAKIAIFTDKTVAKLPVMRVVEESLMKEGLNWVLWDKCAVEPTDSSWQEAIDWTRSANITHFLAVGGGSAMDTAKAANLYNTYKKADLFDFINAPIGKGLPITKKLSPLIAIPTTAGTGSETTGTAVLDIPSRMFKTAIAHRSLKPTLGIVDTNNTRTCPKHVAISAGLDVLFHALESWTAIPYSERSPRPQNPLHRPAYQGSNPLSDIFAKWALEQTIHWLPLIAREPDNADHKGEMLMAASIAGMGFGNAGVHMCHGFSYPISSLNKLREKSKQYSHPSYDPTKPLVPHGLAVSLTAPAVFNFTAPSSPNRHREAAALFLGNERKHELDSVRDEDIGLKLRDEIWRFLESVEVPRGLNAIGYGSEDIENLVAGCLPQRRVLNLAPGLAKDNATEEKEQLTSIIEGSMSW